MVLDRKKIEDELLSPSKRPEIEGAKAQQDWIKFHTDTNLDIARSLPYAKFKAFVRSQLPEDKFITSMNLLKFPLPTNALTESIFTKLSKIFDGRNPAFSYQFHRTQERDDWEWYRQEVLGEPSVWSEKAWRYFQTEINCVMVVDMPLEEDPEDRYPQPYFYFVPISEVVSYSVNRRTGVMDWIIYHSDERIIVIDGDAVAGQRDDPVTDRVGDFDGVFHPIEHIVVVGLRGREVMGLFDDDLIVFHIPIAGNGFQIFFQDFAGNPFDDNGVRERIGGNQIAHRDVFFKAFGEKEEGVGRDIGTGDVEKDLIEEGDDLRFVQSGIDFIIDHHVDF